MPTNTSCKDRVSIKSNDIYLPLVNKIVSCLATEIGIDDSEINEARNHISNACVSTIHNECNNKDKSVFITLTRTENILTAYVAESNKNDKKNGFGERLISLIGNQMKSIKQSASLLKKTQDKKSIKLRYIVLNKHHRN